MQILRMAVKYSWTCRKTSESTLSIAKTSRSWDIAFQNWIFLKKYGILLNFAKLAIWRIFLTVLLAGGIPYMTYALFLRSNMYLGWWEMIFESILVLFQTFLNSIRLLSVSSSSQIHVRPQKQCISPIWISSCQKYG